MCLFMYLHLATIIIVLGKWIKILYKKKKSTYIAENLFNKSWISFFITYVDCETQLVERKLRELNQLDHQDEL